MNPQDPAQPAQPVSSQPPQQPVISPTPSTTGLSPASVSNPLNEDPYSRPNTIFDPKPSPSPFKRPGKKKLLFAGLAVLLVGLVGAAYAFLFFIPNRPQNVYNTSLDRSGRAFAAVIDRTVDETKLKKFTKSDMNIKIAADYGGQTFAGSYTAKFDDTKSNGALSFKSNTDDIDLDLKADFMAKLADGKQFPDAYVRITGLKALSDLGLLSPAFAVYENAWIGVDASYIESLLGGTSTTTEAAPQEQINTQDIVELIHAVSDVTEEYVFTSDSSKAVIENKGFVKSEVLNGIKMNQYKVGINQSNSTSYCKAMIERVMTTKAIKKFTGENIEQTKAAELKKCDGSGKSLSDETLDMWVDTERKLVHKIRVSQKDKADHYAEMGQNYTGGDEVSFFVNYFSGADQQEGTFTITSDMAAGSAKGSFKLESKDPKNPSKITMELDAKPFEGEVDVTPPTESTPLQDVLKALGLQ